METVSDNRWIEGFGGEADAAHVPAQALTPALAEIARAFRAKPFRPHPLARDAHAQTIVGSLRALRLALRGELRHFEPRLLEVEPGVRLLLHCRWQPRRQEAPTLVVLHGLEGSAESLYVLGTARKAFAEGFNVAAVNMRTCGGTEHLTHTLYHSGLTGDIHRVVEELAGRGRLPRVYVAGYSMSGNMVLRLAGEYGAAPPRVLRGVAAVSPSIDLSACARAIERRANWLYRVSFMRSLRRRMRRKAALHPDLYNVRGVRRVRTIRQFDDRFTAPHGGYRDADDYYARASSLPVIRDIRVPTLVLHADDDPLIPGRSFRDATIADNPQVLLVVTPRGGHVGFVADAARADSDRRWAENRVVEFFSRLEKEVASSQ
ncbi:MAG TPA: alpha/beta fold hydrolase [Pyrinomonadaceae bacterium]|nr:alpha/beta fold hydrolase [Pyrinomonadaceae bacterium]